MNLPALRLLLVEDNPSDARLLIQLLKSARAGQTCCEVVHVKRLEEAIAVCQQGMVDAALLDLSLPDSDGLETIIEFKAAIPRIPIIILTGLDDEATALESLKLGAQDYLFKGLIQYPLLIRSIRYAIERTQNAEQLRQSEERYRQLVELCPDAILIESQGRIAFVNTAAVALLGAASAMDLTGRTVLDHIHPNHREVVQHWLSHTRNHDVVATQVEQQWYRLDGSIIDVEVTAAPFTHQNQPAQQIVVRDTSERKRVREGLFKALQQERELNRLKTQFVSMVSHEFRNPLSTIRAFIEILQHHAEKLTDDRKLQYFKLIKTAIAQMTQLLDEVLLLGRSEAGKLKYEPSTLDLEDFCRELVETVTLRSESRHQILFQAVVERSPVQMDETLLTHILANLLSNALKYSPEDSCVRFDVLCEGGDAMFRIEDQGIGIPAEDQQRLFEAFHRASNASKIQGTGLGLAIVKTCVDLHHGQIWVHSEVGVGTTIMVRLPLNPPEADPASR